MIFSFIPNYYIETLSGQYQVLIIILEQHKRDVKLLTFNVINLFCIACVPLYDFVFVSSGIEKLISLVERHQIKNRVFLLKFMFQDTIVN